MDAKNIRMDLHKIPELGRCEFKTKEYILNFAKKLNCKIYEVSLTGVILYFDVKKKHTLCFRADMDALPIKEENNVSYKSKNPGIMHACGHDGHMAILLSYAKWASDNLDELENNIVCLFQPSEEDNLGANDILESNILTELKVERIFGMHIWPNLDKGKIFSMPNGMLATSAEVNIDIIGKTCHAANRSEGIDALLVACSLILKFYEICAKIEEKHLINFGKLVSGTVRNAVSKDAPLEATMRAFDDQVFDFMVRKLKGLIQELEDKYKAKINLSINALYPSVNNDPVLFDEYKNIIDINKLNNPFLQAEDFGCYTRKFPSLFFLLGCGDTPLLHSSNFNFDMDILDIGVNTYKKISKFKY